MTNWHPELDRYRGPRYRAIAEALATDVREGRLPVGTRLPTHRDLAWRLKVTVGTVSRAYAEAERRGLISGEVGRGTYVRAPGALAMLPNLSGRDTEPERPGFIDFSLNYPAEGEEPALLRRTLADVAADGAVEDLLRYYPPAGRARDRAAGAAWITHCTGGALEAAPDRVVVTDGGQHGIAAVFAGLAHAGDIVAVEAMTYPGVKVLAGLLGLRLAPVAIDEHGAIPESFAEVCRAGPVKAFYVLPTLHNPTAAIMPVERRRAIAEIAATHEVAIVEDDLYGFLLDRPPPPIAAFAPSHAYYVTATSKSWAPGLRIGYVHAPAERVDRVAMAMRATTHMATPLTAEIATRWIEDGSAARIAEAKRDSAARRQQFVRDAFAAADVRTQPCSFHFWLPLPPETWRADDFAAAARRRGVGVLPTAAFMVGRTTGGVPAAGGAAGAAPNGVRVCIGQLQSDQEVERGLGILADLLGAPAEPYLSVV
jgi:DNA-binding transcriptional MocR family regulator